MDESGPSAAAEDEDEFDAMEYGSADGSDSEGDESAMDDRQMSDAPVRDVHHTSSATQVRSTSPRPQSSSAGGKKKTPAERALAMERELMTSTVEGGQPHSPGGTRAASAEMHKAQQKFSSSCSTTRISPLARTTPLLPSVPPPSRAKSPTERRKRTHPSGPEAMAGAATTAPTPAPAQSAAARPALRAAPSQSRDDVLCAPVAPRWAPTWAGELSWPDSHPFERLEVHIPPAASAASHSLSPLHDRAPPAIRRALSDAKRLDEVDDLPPEVRLYGKVREKPRVRQSTPIPTIACTSLHPRFQR